jgi:hypothetical protein
MANPKIKISNSITGQATAANRIVRELSKFGPAQRGFIMQMVNAHDFAVEAPVDDKTEALPFDSGL